MASFDILLQNVYKFQQGKTEKVTLYVTWVEGALNAVQQEYPMMLSASEVQQHFRDHLFYGLHNQLHNSMHNLYDDMRIAYPQLMTAAWKAKSEQEDWPGECICGRSTQAEGKDDILIFEWANCAAV